MTEENPLTADQLAKPLAAPIENTAKHDPYINRTFIEMMDKAVDGEFTETMPDFQRALTVGLPTHDPERNDAPVDRSQPEAPVEAAGFTEKPVRGVDDSSDVLVSTDADGDKLTLGYSASRSTIFIRTSPRGFYLTMVKVPGLIKWLVSRKAKHEGSEGASA